MTSGDCDIVLSGSFWLLCTSAFAFFCPPFFTLPLFSLPFGNCFFVCLHFLLFFAWPFLVSLRKRHIWQWNRILSSWYLWEMTVFMLNIMISLYHAIKVCKDNGKFAHYIPNFFNPFSWKPRWIISLFPFFRTHSHTWCNPTPRCTYSLVAIFIENRISFWEYPSFYWSTTCSARPHIWIKKL